MNQNVTDSCEVKRSGRFSSYKCVPEGFRGFQMVSGGFMALKERFHGGFRGFRDFKKFLGFQGDFQGVQGDLK